ncbi:MAG: hypothetical protein FJ276_05770, partial [Planctomycetes bacterium]|nr:hypothetical protein [Planctomycetota bacterium]
MLAQHPTDRQGTRCREGLAPAGSGGIDSTSRHRQRVECPAIRRQPSCRGDAARIQPRRNHQGDLVGQHQQGVPRAMNRRQFIGSAAAVAASFTVRELRGGESDNLYARANTDWLAKCRFGIGVHWTAQTVPRSGTPKTFQRAVADFDLNGFIAAVEHAGADYVLFTAAHALQMLPAPHPVLDTILSGRTCERDLIRALADALAARQKHLLVYYNHSCNGKDDPEWRKAVGYDGTDKGRFAQNLLEIVGWMGERYKDKIKAWWFDSPYSLDTRGPHNSVTTDMTGFQFPWEQFTVAAKIGYPARLVTYNAGV